VFAQDAAEEVATQEPLIDIATEVANLLRSEEVVGFAETLRAGLSTAFANMSVGFQSRAYDAAIGYSNNLVETLLKLMEDPGFAALKDSETGKALVVFAQSIPDVIFTTLKDPLEFGVIESFISVFLLFNTLMASLVSMEFLAAIFSTIESSPDIISRLPLVFPEVLDVFFEGWPVLIEAIVPIAMTAVFLVFFDLSTIVSSFLTLDEATIASVVTVPWNALMDVLSVWRESLFYIMGGTLSAFESCVSLSVHSPRVILGDPIAICLASIPMLLDLCIAPVEYIPGIILSCGFSIGIGILNFVALLLAGTLLNPVALVSSFTEGTLNTVLGWVITLLDLLDLQSLRNGVEVLSEGMANLL
jgi:hypothetical protein